jgi:hypothetical protein
VRTLFLLGILVTLVVIAVKKPNQTAWDTAKELSSNVQTVLSDEQKALVKAIPIKPFKEPLNKFDKAMREAIGDTNSKPPIGKSSSNEEQMKTVINRTSSEEKNTLTPTKPVLEEKKPKPLAVIKSAKDWTDLPTISVKSRPVNIVKNQSASTVQDIETPEQSGYSDIKIYYENASKLLSEIK